MLSVIVALHLLIAIVMIGLILLQKSEGGAAGAGFSASASVESMMRPRARANPIGRATSVLGICFFVTSLALAVLSKPTGTAPTSIMLEPAPGGAPQVPQVAEPPTAGGPAAPQAPAAPSATPAVPEVPNK
jgi:preprotein translocase subunit SecG